VLPAKRATTVYVPALLGTLVRGVPLALVPAK
jgi:hypothetical protein